MINISVLVICIFMKVKCLKQAYVSIASKQRQCEVISTNYRDTISNSVNTVFTIWFEKNKDVDKVCLDFLKVHMVGS